MKATTTFFIATTLLSTLFLGTYTAPSQTVSKFTDHVADDISNSGKLGDKFVDGTIDFFSKFEEIAKNIGIKLTEKSNEDFEKLKKISSGIVGNTNEEVKNVLTKISSGLDKVKDIAGKLYEAGKNDRERLLASLDKTVKKLKASLENLRELAKSQNYAVQKRVEGIFNGVINTIEVFVSNVKKFLQSNNNNCKISASDKQDLFNKMDETENALASLSQSLTKAENFYSSDDKKDIIDVNNFVEMTLITVSESHKQAKAGINAGKATDLRKVSDSFVSALSMFETPISEEGKKLKNFPELLTFYENGTGILKKNAQYGIDVLTATAKDLEAKCSEVV